MLTELIYIVIFIFNFEIYFKFYRMTGQYYNLDGTRLNMYRDWYYELLIVDKVVS